MFKKLAGRSPGFIDEEKYKKYAVAAPFLPDTKELLFEVRAGHLKRQPGEVCFPGGGVEECETPRAAALRETCEELSVLPDTVEIIAPLDILATAHHTVIFPSIAQLHSYAHTFSRCEVDEVFTVPFEFFLNTKPQVLYNRISSRPEDPAQMYGLLGVEDYAWGKARSQVLFYSYKNRLIWGITAKIVENLVVLYSAPGA